VSDEVFDAVVVGSGIGRLTARGCLMTSDGACKHWQRLRGSVGTRHATVPVVKYFDWDDAKNASPQDGALHLVRRDRIYIERGDLNVSYLRQKDASDYLPMLLASASSM
jgi:hypothetical protein